MQPIDPYLAAIVAGTAQKDIEKACLRMMLLSISPDGTHAQTVQERVTCLAFTIGGLWARSGITRYAHLAKWIATASDAEINEVFDGLENGN